MSQPKNDIIAAIAETIEIPDSAYEKAEVRYKDLATWFAEPTSGCAKFDPHVFSQGSFRLGTVIRPLKDDDVYDLDMSCQLRRGYSKQQHSQAELKALVGRDLEAYRKARQIEEAKEERNRCWRLRYQDQLKFHLDTVPCLPENPERKKTIREAMQRFGIAEGLTQTVADLSVNITDRRLPNYSIVSPDWFVGNPEGYALWFESRMRQATSLLESLAREARAASIDELPAYRWKTPLQRCVQLLKRHRDVMFDAYPDARPISIIITTLAARAYKGETDLASAMERILTDMEGLVNPGHPRVPNPVNPAEDFADKWGTVEGRRLQLEQNFRRWVAQARADFLKIAAGTDPQVIAEQALARFCASIDPTELRRKFGIGFPNVVVSPKTVPIAAPARPWRW